MTAICDDVYVESSIDAAHVDRLRADVDVAARNLEHVFGTLRSSPLVLFCQSANCKMAFGAPPAAASASDLGFASPKVVLADGSIAPSAVVVTGPVEGTSRILTHEWVHAEMKAWVDYDLLPTWFNEGTATFLASEPRCSPDAAPNVAFDVTRLTTKAAWQRHLAESRNTLGTYCAARQKIETWMQHFESDELRAEGLKSVMTAVGSGAPFDTAFASF